jgi:hemerythrin-like domain-containing protein
MDETALWPRRAALIACGFAFAAHAAPQAAQKKSEAEEGEEVSPAEDLMREHGVLKRALLVYRHCADGLEKSQDIPPKSILDTANLIRSFVEQYHEKLEEDYLFPRFRKAGKLVELVNVLENQHKAGRAVTARILHSVQGAGWKDPSQRKQLIGDMRAFVRMYEPHEAREDTVLFPAFHGLVSEREWDSLGEEFEKKENQIFHGDGFEKNVDAIAAIEKSLGIYDLAQFTPKL